MNPSLAKATWPACLSALRLDRFLMEELDEADAAEVRAHLGGCARCTNAAAGLREGRESAQLPPLRLVPLADKPRANWRLRAGAAAVGLAAAASLLFAVRRIEPNERLKGSGPGLSMYVQHGDEVRRAGPDEVVAAGDAVRFAVTTPVSAYVAILSLDPNGRGSIYYPLGARAQEVSAGSEVPLPLGTRLDASLGVERVVGLFCTSAVELEPVRAAWEAGAVHIPPGCQVTRWSFVKR